MRPTLVRITVRRSMALVAVIAALLAIIIVPVGRKLEYAKVQREMNDSIQSLRYRAPNGVDPAVWQCAANWTSTAYGNICFSEEHVGIEEMYRLRDEMLAKLSGPADPDLLLWIWERLARTGPHGKRYVGRFRRSFLDCFPAGMVTEPGNSTTFEDSRALDDG
jgi:hypothetical protein